VRTFIVRLQEDSGADAGADALRLRGFVDEVATGLRATFRTDQELVTALAAALTDVPGPPWDANHRVPGSSADSPAKTIGEY
jgi:hypothetical protein